jgi:hypothetical protein
VILRNFGHRCGEQCFQFQCLARDDKAALAQKNQCMRWIPDEHAWYKTPIMEADGGRVTVGGRWEKDPECCGLPNDPTRESSGDVRGMKPPETIKCEDDVIQNS